MYIYLLECGMSHTQFDVLNHARFTLSYRVAICKIRALREEEIIRSMGKQAFMILWDNLNITYKT